mgnify:CR=1 FL=1
MRIIKVVSGNDTFCQEAHENDTYDQIKQAVTESFGEVDEIHVGSFAAEILNGVPVVMSNKYEDE